nr:serine hydrolase [Sporocytophaga myxococcoides]
MWEKVSSPLWGARHGISSLNYQNAFDNYYYQGYRPKHLNAFASGSSAKFNCVWTNSAWSGTEITKIDNAVNGYLSSQGVTGLSIAITKDGRLVFAKGYGTANNSTGEELAPNHSMRIMSISKSVTAVGIMTLIQKGLMSKDDAVFGPGSILGSKYATPAGKQKLNNIRVRHLLWHTSGLKQCNGESVFWDANKTPDDAMAVLLGESNLIIDDTSGQYFYSNTNFFILERIIEQVSKQKYETFIRQNILDKCGIGSSMFVGQSNGNPIAGEASYTPLTKMNLQLWGAFGGWVARPKDLLKFLNRVDGTASPSDILSTSTEKTMTTTSGVDNSNYGFGWIINGSMQAHNGCHGSTRSFLVELGNGVSYAVIINNSPVNDPCSWVLRGAMDAGISTIASYPSINLFDNTGSGTREYAVTAADQGFDATMDVSSINKVIAYPTLSSDGIINFNNASDIKSIVVTDVLGNKESHKAGDKIQTQLKGLLILHVETEQGKVTQKVIVE